MMHSFEKSEFLNDASYNIVTDELLLSVKFGGKYVFKDVSRKDFEDFITADDPDKFFEDNFKSKEKRKV